MLQLHLAGSRSSLRLTDFELTKVLLSMAGVWQQAPDSPTARHPSPWALLSNQHNCLKFMGSGADRTRVLELCFVHMKTGR
jgi:hypothetical protein